MERLIESLDRNTKAVEAMTAANGKATGGGTKAATKPATSKAKDEPAKMDAKTAGETVIAYLKAGDKDERDVAKENVGKIVEHFKAERFTAIDDLDAAIAMLEVFKAGGTPDELAEEDGGESLV